MDLPTFAETHLVFGRMDVAVDRPGGQLEEQQIGGMSPVMEQIAEGLAHRVTHQLVAHHATVDIEELLIGLTAGERRAHHPTPQTKIHGLLVQGQGLIGEGASEQGLQTGAPPRIVERGRQVVERFAVVAQLKGDVRPYQGDAPHHLLQMAELGLLGAQKLTACRGVVEEILHIHASPGRMRRRARLFQGTVAADRDLEGRRRIAAARDQTQPAHRGDARQRLAAEPQGRNRLQIAQIGDLAGGMTRKRQHQLIRRDAAPVVAHAQPLDAAALHVDLHPRALGV